MTSRTGSEYEDVTDLFRSLAAMNENSIEHRRQRDLIVTRCLPLADNIARRFSNRGEGFDDLVQVARMGLMQAVNRFDPEYGSDFLAFAVPTIMGEVRRYFRDQGWSVKVPRRMKEIAPQLNRARDELYQELRRAPTASEIAVHLGLEREEVVQAQIASGAYSTISYDAPRRGGSDDEGPSLSDRFGTIDASLATVVDVETVRPLLSALPERQQTVLWLRFFENMTQSQIGEQLGISQMHVSRLLARSLATMRDQCEAPAPAVLSARRTLASRRNIEQPLELHGKSA